jgi:hypothetical protein
LPKVLPRSKLRLEFGLVGGGLMQDISLQLPVIIYQLRTVGGYTSIHHFLTDKYGRKAVGLFSEY